MRFLFLFQTFVFASIAREGNTFLIHQETWLELLVRKLYIEKNKNKYHAVGNTDACVDDKLMVYFHAPKGRMADMGKNAMSY